MVAGPNGHPHRMFEVRAMGEDDARAIAGWRYPDPYDFYDLERSPEDLAELLDCDEWGRRYFAADGSDGVLAGFLVVKPNGEEVELGLGLRPGLTGRGLGASLLDAALRFAADAFGAKRVSLSVAAFNLRAITVYERAGFEEVERYEHATAGGVHPFVRMRRVLGVAAPED